MPVTVRAPAMLDSGHPLVSFFDRSTPVKVEHARVPEAQRGPLKLFMDMIETPARDAESRALDYGLQLFREAMDDVRHAQGSDDREECGRRALERERATRAASRTSKQRGEEIVAKYKEMVRQSAVYNDKLVNAAQQRMSAVESLWDAVLDLMYSVFRVWTGINWHVASDRQGWHEAALRCKEEAVGWKETAECYRRLAYGSLVSALHLDRSILHVAADDAAASSQRDRSVRVITSAAPVFRTLPVFTPPKK